MINQCGHDGAHKSRVWLILALMCGLAACDAVAPASPYYEAQGTAQARIAEISQHLVLPAKQKTNLLASIQDAHMFEERYGAADVGSSDYCRFFAIRVKPTALENWRQLLPPKPLAQISQYSAPAQPKSWWVTAPVFQTLQFYDAYPLTHLNGRAGIENSGHIYLHICTD